MQTSELWQQILTSPGDKDLRAHYVEALTQENDPRAEVFRLVAALSPHPVHYIQPISSSGREELYQQYETSLTQWRAELDMRARTWQADVSFVGGWPVDITIKARDFIAYATEIVATMPLRHLNLKAAGEASDVFDLPQFAQIASLSGSHQRWTSEVIGALANSAHLGALRWLDLSYAQLKEPEIEILAAAPALRNVEYLHLSHNRCRDPVDAAAGCGRDWYGAIVPESIYLPRFGEQLEARHGRIGWLHALDVYRDEYPPSRYWF